MSSVLYGTGFARLGFVKGLKKYFAKLSVFQTNNRQLDKRQQKINNNLPLFPQPKAPILACKQ